MEVAGLRRKAAKEWHEVLEPFGHEVSHVPLALPYDNHVLTRRDDAPRRRTPWIRRASASTPRWYSKIVDSWVCTLHLASFNI